MKENKTTIFFDLETTGIYWNSDAPVQIAAICEHEGQIIDVFNEKIRTTHIINPAASAVHGIYASQLQSCRSEAAVLKDFVTWILGGNCGLLVGYNSKAFDLPMLNCRCNHLGVKSIFDGAIIPHLDGYYDCVKRAKDAGLLQLKEKMGRKWNLSLVASTLGFNTAGAHDALNDVKMLRQIWHKVNNELKNLT